MMDIDLGLGGSGIAAARGMKKHHGLVSLFVTEHPDRARQAADAALGVLVKPIDSDAVVRALEVVSRLWRGERRAICQRDWSFSLRTPQLKWAADQKVSGPCP